MIGFKSWTLAIKLSILPLHHVLRRISLGQTEGGNRELKQLRRRPKRQVQQTIDLMVKTTVSARASRLLVHFFDVHCTTTTLNLPTWRFMEDRWTYDDKFSFLFLNLNKTLKNSTPGNVACIWHIERVQIDAIKFERTQIHFFSDFFTAVVVVVGYIRYKIIHQRVM